MGGAVFGGWGFGAGAVRPRGGRGRGVYKICFFIDRFAIFRLVDGYVTRLVEKAEPQPN